MSQPGAPGAADSAGVAEAVTRPLALGVIGLGCIGGSIALRARGLGVRVAGFDLPGPLDLALALGLVDEALPTFDAAAACSMLVLATPPEATCRYLEAMAGWTNWHGVAIDVASVKVPVAAAGAPLATFVPTHPIAGSERSGPGAASETLFEGRTWVVVPQGSDEARGRAKAFIGAMGARPLEVDAETHDRAVAITSHLPQIVAVALAAGVSPALDEPLALALAGPGLASMVRLGASSWPLWREVLQANRERVAREVRALSGMFADIAGALERDDVDAMAPVFVAAADVSRRVASANARETPAVTPTSPPPALRPAPEPARSESAIP